MRRRTRLLAAVPLLGLGALSACAPFHAGAAATVGDHRITTQDLRDVVDRLEASSAAYVASGAASSPPQVTPEQAQQRALSELVQVQVLQRASSLLGAPPLPANAVGKELNTVVASEQGATEEQVRQLGAYNGVDLDLFAEFRTWLDAAETAAAPSDAEVTAFASRPDHRVVSVDRIDVANQAVAQQFAQQVRQQPGSFESVVQSAGGQVTTAEYTATELRALAPDAAISGGSIVGPVRVNDGDFAVFAVTAVADDPVTTALAKDSVERAALQQEKFDSAYRSAVSQLGVHVSPRFGAWTFPTADGLGSIGAVPPADQLSTLVSGKSSTSTGNAATAGS